MEPFRFCVATMGAELYGFEVDRSFWYQSAIFQHRLLKWLQIILSIFVTNFDPQGPTIHQNKGNFKRVSGSPLDLVQLLWLLGYIDLKQTCHFCLICLTWFFPPDLFGYHCKKQTALNRYISATIEAISNPKGSLKSP